MRDAFAAAVGEDRARFDAVFDALSDKDGPTAWAYAAFVVGYVVNDIEAAQGDLDVIAQQAINATSNWINIGSQASVRALLKAASEDDAQMPGVPQYEVVNMTFVLGSYLLQAYRADDEEWWDYLDEVWAAATSEPDPK